MRRWLFSGSLFVCLSLWDAMCWGACVPCPTPAGLFQSLHCCLNADGSFRLGSVPEASEHTCMLDLQEAVRWLLHQVAPVHDMTIKTVSDIRTPAQKLRAEADAWEAYEAQLARMKAIAARCASP